MTRGTDVTDMKRTYRTATAAEFPAKLRLELLREADLRYGENPNQSAARYRIEGTDLAVITKLQTIKEGKGGLSATNIMDVTRALEVLKFFSGQPSVAVMKHLVPSGFATQHNDESLDVTYAKARDADARSAFGSVVVANVPLDKATAEAIASSYVEVVAAPGFEEGVMGVLHGKKDLRAVSFKNLDQIPKFVGDDVKFLPTSRAIVQKPYLTSIRGADDLVLDPLVKDKGGNEYVVQRDPTEQELKDMLTAWYVNLGVRSNGIVFVKDGVTVAVGSGQQERVGAVEQAIIKAYQKAMDREGIAYNPLQGIQGSEGLSHDPLEGAVVSSDAFFPFRDSIDLVARVGVTGVIQPGGSVRDYELIQAVNDHKMAMVYTLERCFGHF